MMIDHGLVVALDGGYVVPSMPFWLDLCSQGISDDEKVIYFNNVIFSQKKKTYALFKYVSISNSMWQLRLFVVTLCFVSARSA